MPHFGNSCNYFNLSILLYLLLVISDAIIVNTLGNHDPCLCKTVNLINVCVLTAPPTSYSSIFFLFPHSPYFLIHKNTESRSTNNPTLASKHSRERKSCTFFPVSSKSYKWLSSVEEGMLKAEISWKLGLLHQLAKSQKQRKSF